MNDLQLTIGERIATLIFFIICMPLVFGGLVAVGESGDARVLVCSTLAVLLFAVTLIRRRRGLSQN